MAIVEGTPELLAKLAFGDRDDGIVLVAHAPSTDVADLVLRDGALVGVTGTVTLAGNSWLYPYCDPASGAAHTPDAAMTRRVQAEALARSRGGLVVMMQANPFIVRRIGTDKRGRPEGAIVDVLERANRTIVGRLYEERGITFVPNRLVRALDPARRVAVLDDASELPYDLFLGVPKHCVPAVVAAAGMTVDGWIHVDPQTLKTRFPKVYAVGDVTSVGTPKAGVFSEEAARTVAAEIIAEVRGGPEPLAYRGIGTCYVEFGEQRVGRVDVEFLAGPPTGSFKEPSTALVQEKQHFGSSRRSRWFGM